jgi:hypothetical protein
MKRSSLARSIIFALAAAALGAGAGTARAAVILLDVSGSMSTFGGGGIPTVDPPELPHVNSAATS